MSIEKKHCFTDSAGEDIYLFTLRNYAGTEVCITNYGAIISSFKMNGVNIVLGFDDVRDYFSNDYISQYPYFGCIVGRYANRIKNANFSIDNETYPVTKNLGEHQLHGGNEGFDKKVWEVISDTGNPDSLLLKYTSRDGEEGFPGNLTVIICFELNNANELIIATRATTDKPTAVNLTHHDYFNMNGTGTINKHQVKIDSEFYLGQDDNLFTDGSMIPLAGTTHDFRNFRTVDAAWDPLQGYDQTFVFENSDRNLKLCAECIGDLSAIRLQVFTTEPAVHFYTGKSIPVFRRNGENIFGPYSGMCFETQKHPDAINISHFPETILRPGQEYYEKTIYRVSADDIK